MSSNEMGELAPDPLHFGFFVQGAPASLQGKGKRRDGWQRVVRSVAHDAAVSGAPPYKGDVCVRIWHFCYVPGADLDNILKPILDALKGIAYEDDVQVMEIDARRFLFKTPIAQDYVHEIAYTDEAGVLVRVFERRQ